MLDLRLRRRVDRLLDRLEAGDRSVGVHGDRPTGDQAHRALRIQDALAFNDDVAVPQVGTGHRGLHARPVPAHRHASVDVNVALGQHRPGEPETAAGAEQGAARGRGHLDDAVDGHGRRHQVQQPVGLGDGRIQPGHHGAPRDRERVARLQVGRGTSAGGVDVAARQQGHRAALHVQVVADVDVAHQLHVPCQGLHPQPAHLGLAE